MLSFALRVERVPDAVGDLVVGWGKGTLGVTGFLGAARYDLATPAYGVYLGAGAQWRDLVPRLDLSLDLRYASKVARDHLVSGDPVGGRGDSFYDITSAALYLSYRF